MLYFRVYEVLWLFFLKFLRPERNTINFNHHIKMKVQHLMLLAEQRVNKATEHNPRSTEHNMERSPSSQ